MNSGRGAVLALLAAATVACASSPPPRANPSIVVSAPATPTADTTARRTSHPDPLAPSLEPPIFYSILFPSSDPHPPADTLPLLDEVVGELNARPELMLEVNGHIENGERQGLGFTRAKLVSNYLVDHGLQRRRIRIVDRGDGEPASARDPSQNRRVSFRPYEEKP